MRLKFCYADRMAKVEFNDDEKFIALIIQGINRVLASKKPYANAKALAEAAGINANNLTRWLKGTRKPTLRVLSPVLSLLEVKVSFKGEAPYPRDGMDAEIVAHLNKVIQLRDRPDIALRLWPHIPDEDTRNATLNGLLDGTIPMTAGMFWRIADHADSTRKPGTLLEDIRRAYTEKLGSMPHGINEPPRPFPDTHRQVAGPGGSSILAPCEETMQDTLAEYGVQRAANGDSASRKRN